MHAHVDTKGVASGLVGSGSLCRVGVNLSRASWTHPSLSGLASTHWNTLVRRSLMTNRNHSYPLNMLLCLILQLRCTDLLFLSDFVRVGLDNNWQHTQAFVMTLLQMLGHNEAFTIPKHGRFWFVVKPYSKVSASPWNVDLHVLQIAFFTFHFFWGWLWCATASTMSNKYAFNITFPKGNIYSMTQSVSSVAVPVIECQYFTSLIWAVNLLCSCGAQNCYWYAAWHVFKVLFGCECIHGAQIHIAGYLFFSIFQFSCVWVQIGFDEVLFSSSLNWHL